MSSKTIVSCLAGAHALLLTSVSMTCAQLVIETVTIANPGNAGEMSGVGAGGWGADRICGAVDYVYEIGKFEVTAGQYAAFLNAVAAEDTYGLYNPDMWSGSYGCKIERTGSSPDYGYSVGPEWADRPVNYVSWGDAARFANWLHNGQPTGAQDTSTTEAGSYYLDGATGNTELIAVVRAENATWVIPSEDEWYKAAYHHNDGATANYYDYPTSTDTVPNNGNPEGDTGNSANFHDGDVTIGSPYWRTEVGFFGLSESPYGTLDQGGNVWEWNEEVVYDIYRGSRGGAFDSYSALRAAYRDSSFPAYENGLIGFRVAALSEPVDVKGYDLADFAAFQRCFGSEPNALCRIAFDCNNADGVVDLDDYAAFHARFTGEGAPPCGMALISGGEFEMGCHAETGEPCYSAELPVHDVFVDSFHMDVYEVTIQQYTDALNWAWSQGGLITVSGGIVYKAGSSEPYCHTYAFDDHSRILWNGSTFSVTGGREDHPVMWASWYGAVAYANWRSVQDGRTPSYNLTTWECNFEANGYRLPTEAEWEYAARGAHGFYYAYPWGNTIDGSKANYWYSGDPYETGDYPETTPVGFYDGGQTPSGADMANGYGLYDMSGNAWEWCNDRWSGDYYSISPYDNPRGPASGFARVIRGGSSGCMVSDLRCADRYFYYTPDRRIGGFRLVLDSD